MALSNKKSINNRSDLLPLLKDYVNKHSSLTKKGMEEIAAIAGLSLSEVYGVATFYSFLPVVKKGRNVVRVCQCLPCDMKDSKTIMESIKKVIGIGPGETTGDGKFSLEAGNCIGACDRAPAMMINDELYADLTPEKIKEVFESFK
jgi:NADH:ubiquinone oxidoreductase subunit E